MTQKAKTYRYDRTEMCALFKRDVGGSVVYWLEFSHPTSEAAGSNLGPGASCWKVGSYLLMPGGLQCSMHWFPAPEKLPVAI